MSTTNDALLQALSLDAMSVIDNLAAPNAASQSTATKCPGPVNRVTTSVANGSCVLPSVLSNEANSMVFVINDSPNSINVYPFTGEKMIGVANAAFAVASGLSGFFVRIPPSIGRGGGGGGTNDWRAAAVP